MPFSLRKLTKTNLVALCLVALLVFAVLAFGKRA